MLPKQRVLNTIFRQPVDRVPVNYYGNADINRRLHKHFNTDDILAALDIDFRYVAAPYIGPKLHEDKGDIRVDDWGRHCKWVEHPAGGYFDFCEWPLTSATIEQIEAWPMPDPDDYDYSQIEPACDKYQDYCLVVGNAGTGDIINSNGMLRTMEQVLVDLITDDPAGLHLIDRRTDIMLKIIERTLHAANGKFDMMSLGEDLGTQRGPTLSLDLFRKHIRPRLQQFIDLAKSYNLPVMIHCCGSSSWAFNDFIEMGIDVVETLQPEAVDMAPAYLKKTYGDQLAFHGCISTAGPLAYGSPEQVTQNVRETLGVMMPGGGYILSPTHAIQDNSPTENVLAMYQAAREYGKY